MLRVLLLAGAVAFVDSPAPPDLPEAARKPVACVYHLLKANARVRSADVFVVDGFRTAIEYRFAAKDGRVLVGDAMFTDVDDSVSYGISAVHGEPDEDGFVALDFLERLVPDLDARCGIVPALDNLLPSPPARADWREVLPTD